MFILSQTIHSSLFSPTVNFTVLHHIYSAINTPSYPLPLHTHSTPSAKLNTPPTQLLRSAGYTHSVASPLVHPPGKHLHSTTSNITTPHDTDSTQDSTNPYITFLTNILNICWYTCWFVCFLVYVA
jgi:ubiquitin C-terminal hydrolase